MTKLLTIFAMALCMFIGVVGGFAVGKEKSAPSSEHGSQEESQEEHEEGLFSSETLKNMGIEIAPARLADFVQYQDLPAKVEPYELSSQPVFSPIGGTIDQIRVVPGALVEKGETLITIMREPWPRIQLDLTEEIIKPVSEEFHQSLTKFRRFQKERQILGKELQRLQKYSGNKDKESYALVPGKNLIELRYQFERAKHELEMAEHELIWHGLSEEQIKKGQFEMISRIDVQVWQKALAKHGLWTDLGENIYSLLSKEIQDSPWTVATIGELMAGGYLKEDLLLWLKERPEKGKHFLAIGGLLQNGHTLIQIQYLDSLNAFAPLVELKAPARVANWDVAQIQVKKGQRVEAGDPLITLLDLRKMYLVAEPIGTEKALVLEALQKKLPLQAEALLPGTGPSFADLNFFRLENIHEKSTFRAYVQIKNKSLHTVKEGGRSFRSWELNENLPYKLRIPKKTIQQSYVFPRDAIAEEGAKRFVFIQNGGNFEPIEVHVLYQDEELVVVSNANIFPGDPIVQRGGFALGLALKSSEPSEGGDHHGHSH